jgi:hypothetical protein
MRLATCPGGPGTGWVIADDSMYRRGLRSGEVLVALADGTVRLGRGGWPSLGRLAVVAVPAAQEVRP